MRAKGHTTAGRQIVRESRVRGGGPASGRCVDAEQEIRRDQQRRGRRDALSNECSCSCALDSATYFQPRAATVPERECRLVRSPGAGRDAGIEVPHV